MIAALLHVATMRVLTLTFRKQGERHGNTEITKRENVQSCRNKGVEAVEQPEVIKGCEISGSIGAHTSPQSQRREEVTLTHSPASQSQLRTERQRCAGGRLFRLREPDRDRRAFLPRPSQTPLRLLRSGQGVRGRIRWPTLEVLV